MGDVDRANHTARAAAQYAERPTYTHQVVDYWPACTACGTPIRHNVNTGRPGLWRECACPALWSCGVNGWERHDAAALARTPHEEQDSPDLTGTPEEP